MDTPPRQDQDGPQQPLGWQVEVLDPLPAWMFGGGWADGSHTHQPGSRLFLDHQVGDRVYYQGYTCQGILGWFPADQMGLVRRLPGTLETEHDYRRAMASLERIFTTARPGTPEGDEFERLAALIGDYETRNNLGREGGAYVPTLDDKELLLLAIQRFRAVETDQDFDQATLYSTGVNLRLLRIRPDLDRELFAAYEGACLRTGRIPMSR